MDILSLIIGIITGIVIGYLLAIVLKKNQNLSTGSPEGDLIQKTNQLESENRTLRDEKSKLEGSVERAREVFKDMEVKLKTEQEQNRSLIAQLSTAKAERAAIEDKLQLQKKDIEELQQKFKLEFENIANKLLDEKSAKFSQQHQEKLDTILKPFNEKIKDFENTVKDTYVKGTQERSALVEQIKSLTELNQQMRTDAQNLTKALKSDSKQQGNWGELKLDLILEGSGLVKGEEYELQFSTTNDEGKRFQPDAVVKLPENKHIVVDSKVSLTDYEKWVNEENELLKETFLKQHIQSIRNHIKGLEEKNYSALKGLNSPEVVLMFIPVEPCFSVAVTADKELYQFAWDRKIVMVTPSTLLATLKTIASIWKQERQNKNAIRIAEEAGRLYDKFVGFLEDMEAIKKSIDNSEKAYDSAINKLKTGSGNLIKRAEDIRKLGAKTNKNLPPNLIDDDNLKLEE